MTTMSNETKTSDFSHTLKESGQFRAYSDSRAVYEIRVPINASREAVWDYCQTVKAVAHRNDSSGQHSGSCGFPFGLSAFGGLWHVGDDKWKYSVIYPYCD
jgi:hypothetical protein